jgi:putative MATE family efflux protein
MTEKNMAILTEGPVGKALVRLTGPMILGIAGMVAFNLTDTFFIGRLGPTHLAALSFTFPVVLIVNSIAIGLGIGASAIISRAVGEGNFDEVKRLTTDSLTLTLAVVAVFVVIGFLTIDTVFERLGATPRTLPLIKQYMKIWYMGMIFVVAPMVGNNAMRAHGDTKTPALIMLIAVIVNVVLDPLLIFGIGPFPRLEIQGAAIATVFARMTVFFVALFVLYFRHRMLTFVRVGFGSVWNCWRRVLYIGLPTAASRVVIPIAIGVVTRIVSSYGEEAVAGYGVASRIEFFALAVIFALSTVIGPFVGQNLGAGENDRVNRGIRLSNRFAVAWGVGMLALLAFPARHIVSIFSDDPDVIGTASLYLRIVPIGYGLQGVFIISTSTMNVLKKPIHAASMTVLEMFVILVPLAFLGSSLFGIVGVFGAMPIAYIATGFVSCLLLGRFLVEAEGSGFTRAC